MSLLSERFEVFEHTADVGIIAYGKTLSEAFENAALGMFDIILSNVLCRGIRVHLHQLDYIPEPARFLSNQV